MRTCIKCGETKALDQFYKDGFYGGRKHANNRCIACCHEEKRAWKRRNPEKVNAFKRRSQRRSRANIEARFRLWEKSAIQRGLEFKISLDYVKALPLICHYSGQELTCDSVKPNTVSLDRLDSSKGYIEGNIVLCTKEINVMKMQHSEQYFIELCKKVASHRL